MQFFSRYNYFQYIFDVIYNQTIKLYRTTFLYSQRMSYFYFNLNLLILFYRIKVKTFVDIIKIIHYYSLSAVQQRWGCWTLLHLTEELSSSCRGNATQQPAPPTCPVTSPTTPKPLRMRSSSSSRRSRTISTLTLRVSLVEYTRSVAGHRYLTINHLVL